MLKSIPFKAIYSIFRNSLKHGILRFNYTDNNLNVKAPSFTVKPDCYRTIDIKSISEKYESEIDAYDIYTLIEKIYFILHIEKYEFIVFKRELDFSIAKKISLSHGYNKNILIYKFNKTQTTYIKAICAFYEYTRNN